MRRQSSAYHVPPVPSTCFFFLSTTQILDTVGLKDYICDEPEEDDGQPIGEAVAMWTGIAASGLAIFVGVWQGYEWGKRRKGRERAKKASPPEEKQNETTASAS